MKQKIKKILQKTLLIVFYNYFNLFKKKDSYEWVIGVDEIANSIFNLGNTLERSITVCLTTNKYYNSKYNISNHVENKYFAYLYRIFYAPILLGRLANQTTHFWYIWHTGFLIDRDFEFKFLKSKGKKIICMFVGDDIRSPLLVKDYLQRKGIDGFTEYLGSQHPFYLTKQYDDEKFELAKSADMYADVIFSYKLDQMSYLKSTTYPIAYMYDRNNFFKNDNKFLNIKKIKILHAPSNPFVKGTPLVRSAIKKLEIEGYDFEYIEIQNMSNEIVLYHLRTAHIVMNQFYGYDIALGLLTIESMANHCATMISYDPESMNLYNIELEGIEKCCINTKYWEVYDNLKDLLDNPEKIKYYADNGYQFAINHYTYEKASKYIHKVLKENGVIE